jgi:hypothetical protein
MMKNYILTGGLVILAFIAGSFMSPFTTVAAQQAQQVSRSVAKTQSGFAVEEVRIGNSCVVVVSNQGVSQTVAAIPCGDGSR